MSRFDRSQEQLLAERGPIRGRLIRGLFWALLLAFLGSIVAFSVAVYPQIERGYFTFF